MSCKNENIFEVENLLSETKELVHGRRLKFFRNRLSEVNEEVEHHLTYQENDLLVVEEFQDIKRDQEGIKVFVKWRGFEDSENDWVLLDKLQHDVPNLIEEYLKSFENRRYNKVKTSHQILMTSAIS